MTPCKGIINANYADDPALLVNTPAQVESLLHYLEQAASGIGLYMNSHKPVFFWFRVELEAIVMKGHTTFPKSPRLGPCHQIV